MTCEGPSRSSWGAHSTRATQSMTADRSVSARPGFVRGFVVRRAFDVFNDAEAWPTPLQNGLKMYDDKHCFVCVFGTCHVIPFLTPESITN